jgi:type IV pilus assembly protein PilN
MIRINLLNVPKSKGKRAAVALPGEGVGLWLKAVVALALAATLNGGYWYQLNREKDRMAVQMARAERENRTLAEVKARFVERQKQMETYKHRVDVIDQLRANQSGPVNLLATLGETVNNTEAVWLSVMKDEGNQIHLEGMALSESAMANLVSNLQKTHYFRNVELKESYQDDQVKDMQAFVFTLTCEKQKS